MSAFVGLRTPLAIAACCAVLTLALWFLAMTGFSMFIVPQPDDMVEQFVRALKAHRYEAARDMLAEELRRQVSTDDLRSQVLSIEAREGGFADAYAIDVTKGSDSATAWVRVKPASGKERVSQFTLGKQHGLWRIVSLDALD